MLDRMKVIIYYKFLINNIHNNNKKKKNRKIKLQINFSCKFKSKL